MNAPTYGKRGGLKAFDRGLRNVSNAYGKDTFLTYGQKAGGGLAVEVGSERLVAHMLNLDPDVVAYTPQPFTVELTTGSIAHSKEEKDALRASVKRCGSKAAFYTPDFALSWSSNVQAALEVKSEGFAGDADYQHKLKLAADILFSHGYEFLQVVMSSNWRDPLRTSLPLLHIAHMRKDVWPKPETGDRIAQLHDAGATTMGDFLHGLELDSRMSPLLLVSGHLQVDIVTHPLCFATPTAPSFGDLSHLQLIRKLAQ